MDHLTLEIAVLTPHTTRTVRAKDWSDTAIPTPELTSKLTPTVCWKQGLMGSADLQIGLDKAVHDGDFSNAMTVPFLTDDPSSISAPGASSGLIETAQSTTDYSSTESDAVPRSASLSGGGMYSDGISSVYESCVSNDVFLSSSRPGGPEKIDFVPFSEMPPDLFAAISGTAMPSQEIIDHDHWSSHEEEQPCWKNEDENENLNLNLDTILQRVASDIYDLQSQQGELGSNCLEWSDPIMCSTVPTSSNIATFPSPSSSEAYFSTASHFTDTETGGAKSRSPSYCELVENASCGSEENFADVESLEVTTNHPRKGRRTNLRLRKPQHQLHNILSPSLIGMVPQDMSPWCIDSVKVLNDDGFSTSEAEYDNVDSSGFCDGTTSTITASSGNDCSSTIASSSSSSGTTTTTSTTSHTSCTSDCSDIIESSGLNPHSKPFIPRSHSLLSDTGYADSSAYLTGHHDTSRFVTHTEDFNTVLGDSGYCPATDSIRAQHSAWGCSNSIIFPTFYENAFLSENNINEKLPMKQDVKKNFVTSETPGGHSLSFRHILDSRYPLTPDETLYSASTNPQRHEYTPVPTFAIKDRTQLRQDDYHGNAFPPEPPYICKAPHSFNDFIMVERFSVHDLPEGNQKLDNVEAIRAISQRVVCLRVTKPYRSNRWVKPTNASQTNQHILSSDTDFTDTFEHLGTGFVYYIDSEDINIRTHSGVVGNSEEAEKTKVSFSISGRRMRHETLIHCRGDGKGFHSNLHTGTSVFSCKTPRELLPYLNTFKDFPVRYRSSFFNDSSYFTDSSPNTSVEQDLDLLKQNKVKNSTDKNNNIVPLSMPDAIDNSVQQQFRSFVEEESQNMRGENETLNLGFEYHKDALQLDEAPEYFLGEVLQNEGYLLENDPLGPEVKREVVPQNPFAYCGVDEVAVRNAFESVDNYVIYEQSSRQASKPEDSCSPPCSARRTLKDSSHLRTNSSALLSPLRIMEARMETAATSASCPYGNRNLFGSLGQYDHFSSHSGDMLSKCQLIATACFNLSPYADQANGGTWEYEGLVHAQTHHRHEYNRLYKPTTLWNIPSVFDEGLGGSSRTSSPGRETRPNSQSPSPSKALQELSSVESYRKTWDLDLLNLNENFLPLSDPVEDILDADLDAMVDEIMKEHPKCVVDCLEHSCGENVDSSTCIIISHPHGGDKMVSVGLFSRHQHLGGGLYDTPTCMGSCGAPIIAIPRDGGGPYVTPLIHAGTSRVNDVHVGMGVAYLPEHKRTFHQTFNTA